jgi:hypothetical protein
MLWRIEIILSRIFYSFPIQLLLNNIRRNPVLLLCWVVLFAIITGNFGRYLGIPYLFLDPEYLNAVSFKSFFIMGLVLAGFSTAFHISCYIADGHRFTFIGVVSRPFTKFSLNNSIIPTLFLLYYMLCIIEYQLENEFTEPYKIAIYITGLLAGHFSMKLLLFSYFWFTNKDIFRYMVCKLDEKLKANIKVTRLSAMKKLDIARKKQVRVDHYLDIDLRFKRATDYDGFYDRSAIIQVFDQNHFNLVIIQFAIFSLLLLMGIFKDLPIFQLPAAASFVLFLTIFIMFSGAFSYWFGGWSVTTAVGLFLAFNLFSKTDLISKRYQAFGINYEVPAAPYSRETLQEAITPEPFEGDKQATLKILENWRAKFEADKKPKMVFICTSGGGQRAALWALTALQKADSLTQGQLMENTMMITGASGGLVGAAYFRELYLRKKLGDSLHLQSPLYRKNISSDNLNPIIFSLLVNDLFVGFIKFEYQGLQYDRDRGYSFEQQLNKNTQGVLDKPLSAYREPEQKAQIPMLVMAPTIINDGRKLYISPQHVSYLNGFAPYEQGSKQKVNGVDFLRFFHQQNSENIRFLSALRMSATFPYITPNVTLPSDPPIEIMDAGISDNFGISDAVRFLYTFREWISENTSGVVFLAIRDSEKDGPIHKKSNPSLLEKFSLPISGIYQNFENLQDMNNDAKLEFARTWFDGPLHRIHIEYIPRDLPMKPTEAHAADSVQQEQARRASLSWRLTGREKQSIISNMETPRNQRALRELKQLLEE